MHASMPPPAPFGFGEIPGRYVSEPLPSYPAHPWYFDQTKTSIVAILAIAAIVAAGAVF